MPYPIIQAIKFFIFISVVAYLCIISTKSDAARPEIGGEAAMPEIGGEATKPKISEATEPKIDHAAGPKIDQATGPKIDEAAGKPKIWRSGCDWWGMNCATGFFRQRSPPQRAGG